HLLEQCGLNPILAGNIRVPLLDHLDASASLVVAELSSYQLSDLEGRLAMGLMTRLFDEHLDWHGSREAYFASKLRMVDLLAGNPLLVDATDPVLLVATAGVAHRVACNRPPGLHRSGDEIRQGDSLLIRGRDLALIGRHNLDNAVLAIEAARRLDCTLDRVKRALGAFKPLPHRLENLGSVADRYWVNDSIATSPHATLAALDALQGSPVTLIAGGQPRPADWQVVIDRLQRRGLAGLVALPDNGPAIARQLIDSGVIARELVCSAADMDTAVETAVHLSPPGGTIVLSPGAPSFPIYRDFEDRGDCFRAALARYRDRSTA
ncbi:MAG: Mur ligase family protein, partial [Wenzhouxiangella sp.]|nr:Mur ligase family protein [Wenzhouxiangella sp.]